MRANGNKLNEKSMSESWEITATSEHWGMKVLPVALSSAALIKRPDKHTYMASARLNN